MTADQAEIWQNASGLFTELAREVEAIMVADPGPTLAPITRRQLVRSAFALIEAQVFTLKQAALTIPNHELRLSLGEITLAREEDFELSESGDVYTRSARLNFSGNVKFAFKLFAKAAIIPNVLNTSGRNWRRLQQATPVRARLMHPKKLADLTVSDDEIGSVLKTCDWFGTCVRLTEFLYCLAYTHHFPNVAKELSETHRMFAETINGIHEQRQEELELPAELPECVRQLAQGVYVPA